MTEPQFTLNTKESSYKDIIIRLDEYRYALGGTTRKGAERLLAAEAEFEALQGEVKPEDRTLEQAEKALRAALTIVDTRLKPLDDAPPAGEYLAAKWDAGELELEQVEDLARFVGEKADEIKAATRPPASASNAST